MNSCERCLKCFRDNFDLSRHQSRIRQCKIKIVEKDIPQIAEKDTLEGKKDTLEGKKDTLEGKKDTLEGKKDTCKYCLNEYSSKKYKNTHENICKQKDDPIRQLEIEQDICPVLPASKTCCRYCDKELSRVSYLNKHTLICKERSEYLSLLEKQKKSNTFINIGTQNNNNITNNKLILNFGKENLNHVQIENVINLLRGIRKEFGNNQVYLMAGDLITSFDNYIREEPENNNLLIPDAKCLYAETRIENGWEKKSIDYSLNKAFKSSANELYTRKKEINDTNDKVFKSDTNKEIFLEVKQFADKGFSHYPTSEELRKVKTNFKLSKLKNKVILDF